MQSKRFMVLLAVLLFAFLFAAWNSHSAAPSAAARTAGDSTGVALRSFSEERIQEFKENRQFQYDQAPYYGENLLQLALKKLAALINDLFANKTGRDIILYGILAIMVILITLQLIRVRPAALFFKNTQTSQFAWGQQEAAYQPDKLENAREEAVRNGNYRQALRHLFTLAVLRLDEQGLLRFEPQKTVTEYLYELENSYKKHLFQELARHFEYVWYGNFAIDKETYRQLETVYNEKINRE